MLFILVLVSSLVMVCLIEWSPLLAALLTALGILAWASQDYYLPRNCKLRAILRLRSERAAKAEVAPSREMTFLEEFHLLEM